MYKNEMKNMINIFLLALLSLSIYGESGILVLEFKGEEHTTWHGEEVSAIACQSHLESCYVEYTGSFSESAFEDSIAESILNSFVINMSFSIFAPLAPSRDMRDVIAGNTDKYENDLLLYQNALNTFKTEKIFLDNLLKDNSDKLFVIAAGNGFALEAMIIPGVVVSKKYALYPSLMSYENTLKVASLEQASINKADLDNHNLASYSNFGITHVDIAAPVPLNSKGKVQRGTSFAAPWVVQHAAKLKELYPKLSTLEVKEMLMKSAYVPNIKKALSASLDMLEQGSESLLYKAQHESNVRKRKEFLSKLGKDVYLIKSGGFLLPELLYKCAENYHTKLKYSVELACLKAQQAILSRTSEEINELVNLWRLRGI